MERQREREAQHGKHIISSQKEQTHTCWRAHLSMVRASTCRVRSKMGNLLHQRPEPLGLASVRVGHGQMVCLCNQWVQVSVGTEWSSASPAL